MAQKQENTDSGKKRREAVLRSRSGFDYSLLFVVLFLLGFGLVMIYSTSSFVASVENNDGLFYLRRQAISTAVGLVVMFFCTFFPYYLYDKLSPLIFAVAIVMIPLVKTTLGVKANGATRWFKVFGFSVQPSEYAKLAIVIVTASIVSKIGRNGLKTWRAMLISFVLHAIVRVMILLLTKNLSSAIIIAGMAFIMFVVASPKNYRPYVLLALAVAGAVFIVVAVVNGWFSEYIGFRGERILAWLDLEKYADGKGYQTLQSLYGIGSGGLWGKGLGKSIQKLGFLPEAQNDMIFSIICEELGIIGGLAIIFMFALLLWRLFAITIYCTDMFSVLIVSGVFAQIALQVIINISVVTNTIPNTGITLPFISYGGSSVIFLLAEIGIVMNISSHLDYRKDRPAKQGEKAQKEKEEQQTEEA